MNKEKRESLLTKVSGFLQNVAEFFTPVNFDYSDADGNLLFSTASESDTLAVGDEVAFPGEEVSGTFELPDGRKVVIADKIVTEIVEPSMNELEALKVENEQLKNKLNEAVTLINELKNEFGSNYKPVNRVVTRTVETKSVKAQAINNANNIVNKESLSETFKKGFSSRSIVAKK